MVLRSDFLLISLIKQLWPISARLPPEQGSLLCFLWLLSLKGYYRGFGNQMQSRIWMSLGVWSSRVLRTHTQRHLQTSSKCTICLARCSVANGNRHKMIISSVSLENGSVLAPWSLPLLKWFLLRMLFTTALKSQYGSNAASVSVEMRFSERFWDMAALRAVFQNKHKYKYGTCKSSQPSKVSAHWTYCSSHRFGVCMFSASSPLQRLN